MYIVELFIKITEDIKKGKFKKNKKPDIKDVAPEKCEHTFFPIDSTGKILACSKCGEIYKLKNKEINPFKKE